MADQVEANDQGPETSEGSLIGRFVAILTPIFALAAGWLAGWVAQRMPGAHLDQSQIVAFMIAVSTAALTSGWKWLQGWRQHERLVAAGQAKPIKAAPNTKKARSVRNQ